MESGVQQCDSCSADLTEGARFCNRCGAAVSDSTPSADDPTGEIPIPVADEPTEALAIDFESLASTRRMESIDSDELERTARFVAAEEPALDAPLMWADGDRPFDDTIDDTPVAGIAIDPDATTTVIERLVPDDPAPVAPAPPTPPITPIVFRPTVMTAIGVVALVVVLVGLTADLIAISTTAGPSMADIAESIGLQSGVWHVDDMASNLTVAGLIAAIGLAVGSVAAGFGRSWGAGLIGGSGLAIAGLAGLAVGLVEYPIRVATDFAGVGSAEAFTVTITRDLGYWALLAAAGIGIIAFFASVNDMVIDRSNDLNPLVAAVGALAVVAMVIGPMTPIAPATWSQNWVIGDDASSWQTILLIGRSIQLAGIGIGGILGFLSVRRFGLGLIAGALAPPLWMTLTTWIGLGSSPIGPGHRNPGGLTTSVSGLTVTGAVAALALLVVAGVIAWERTQNRVPARSTIS